jgi:hypothetical protein
MYVRKETGMNWSYYNLSEFTYKAVYFLNIYISIFIYNYFYDYPIE